MQVFFFYYLHNSHASGNEVSFLCRLHELWTHDNKKGNLLPQISPYTLYISFIFYDTFYSPYCNFF